MDSLQSIIESLQHAIVDSKLDNGSIVLGDALEEKILSTVPADAAREIVAKINDRSRTGTIEGMDGRSYVDKEEVISIIQEAFSYDPKKT